VKSEKLKVKSEEIRVKKGEKGAEEASFSLFSLYLCSLN
jgi:hypothetical protein